MKKLLLILLMLPLLSNAQWSFDRNECRLSAIKDGQTRVMFDISTLSYEDRYSNHISVYDGIRSLTLNVNDIDDYASNQGDSLKLDLDAYILLCRDARLNGDTLIVGGDTVVVGSGSAEVSYSIDTLTATDDTVSFSISNQNASYYYKLTGDAHLPTPTNAVAGNCYTIAIQQDSIGGHALTYGSNYFWASGDSLVVPTAANGYSLMSAYFNGSSFIAYYNSPYDLSVTEPSELDSLPSFYVRNNNRHVTVANDPSLVFGDAVTDTSFSLSIWIKRDLGQTAKQSGLFGKFQEYKMYINFAEELEISVYSGTSTDKLSKTKELDNLIDDDEWHQLVMTYDGSATIGGLKGYLDGEEITGMVDESAGTYVAMEDRTGAFGFGWEWGSQVMDGWYADPIVWGVALDSAQVATIYNESGGEGCPRDEVNGDLSSLIISAWSAESATDGTGNVTDLVGSNDGTMTSGMTVADNIDNTKYPCNELPAAPLGLAFGDTVTILATGQSNCSSYCTSTGGIITVSDSVEIWNGSSWIHAVIGTAPLKADAGSYVLSLAKKISEDDGKVVRIIKECYDGNEIERWLAPGYIRMQEIWGEVGNSGTTKVDIIAWHQGEANHDGSSFCNDDTCYEEKLDSVQTYFRERDWFEGYFIAGQLLPGSSTNDRDPVLLALNDSYDDLDACAVATDLVGCDGIHFTGASLDSLGVRYYEALQLLIP